MRTRVEHPEPTHPVTTAWRGKTARLATLAAIILTVIALSIATVQTATAIQEGSIPPDEVPSELSEAIAQHAPDLIEGRLTAGAYVGPCEEVADDSLGELCSFVVSLETDRAEVVLAVTASDASIDVTFVREGNVWRPEAEEPGPPATGSGGVAEDVAPVAMGGGLASHDATWSILLVAALVLGGSAAGILATSAVRRR